jgi:hypothetical protein
MPLCGRESILRRDRSGAVTKGHLVDGATRGRLGPTTSMANSLDETHAVSVAATNRRETAGLLVERAEFSTRCPTGSRPTWERRVDKPASIRSIAIRPSTSVEEKSS